jgi:glucose/arabinose dehydrogenase
LALQPLIKNLLASWAINVSPDNFLYVTHRAGELAKYSLSGVLIATIDLQLDDLYNKGQGGVSAIAFHPDFLQNPWIYVSYSYGSEKANGLKVIRVLLARSESTEDEKGSADVASFRSSVAQKDLIFEQVDLRDTAVHCGARLAFMGDGS